jgi:hypothetical protein
MREGKWPPRAPSEIVVSGRKSPRVHRTHDGKPAAEGEEFFKIERTTRECL